MTRIIVTGGAGFIGSNFVLDWLKHSQEPVINRYCYAVVVLLIALAIAGTLALI
jgi:dTDP-D-glucose 4,6-dehydratase